MRHLLKTVYAFTIAALLAASITACACSHHSIDTAAAAGSCHSESSADHTAVGMEMPAADSASVETGRIDEGCFCAASRQDSRASSQIGFDNRSDNAAVAEENDLIVTDTVWSAAVPAARKPASSILKRLRYRTLVRAFPRTAAPLKLDKPCLIGALSSTNSPGVHKFACPVARYLGEEK